MRSGGNGQRHPVLLERAHADLVKRLRIRQPDIEAAIFARVLAMQESKGSEDAEYEAGLRRAVAAVVDSCLTSIEQGEHWTPPIPSEAITQARRAARACVSLKTVLLRYTAGHTVLAEFVTEESEHSDFKGQRVALLRTLGMQLERLQVAIASEYNQELERADGSHDLRRAELVYRLLVGGPVDIAESDYEFNAWHLGVIATGVGGAGAVRSLARDLGREPLLIARSDESIWAWFGGRQRLESADVERRFSASEDSGISLAIGEPGRGIEGFRLTHQQAQGALLVAVRRPRRLTRYAEDMLLAAALRDKTLGSSLEEVYLSPLCRERDGGVALCETLRAYFEADHNVGAAAQRLGADRGTVRKRLRMIEHRLGCLLHTRQAELEVALSLKELGQVASAQDQPPTALQAA
jgi:hypothetical protein